MNRAFLAALQLADSSLPVGRFVHSFGLEAMLEREPDLRESEIVEIVESAVEGAVAPLDAVVLAYAHDAARAREIDRLVALDAFVGLYKLAPASRAASIGCGRRLAALAPSLTDDEIAAALCRRVVGGETAGHLAVVEGTVAAAFGIGRDEAILIELRGAAAALLSAAVRLGRLTAFAAQKALRELETALLAAAARAAAASIEDVHSWLPELEVHALRHGSADARIFAT